MLQAYGMNKIINKCDFLHWAYGSDWQKTIFSSIACQWKLFVSDPFCSKLNGLQRGAKDFFGKLDADDKNLKMSKFACFTTSTSKVKDEQKWLFTYVYCKSDPEILFYD